MLTAYEAVVENGQIRFLEEFALPEGARLVVTVLDAEKHDNDRNEAIRAELAYVPQTALGIKIKNTRLRILESGEPLLDAEGIAKEVAERRGERG